MRRHAWIAILLLAAAGVLSAAHITDRLLVGLYAEPDLQQTPLELLESGTALDVQERRNGFVRVKLSGGKQGWVEAIYVMEEKPARMRLLEAQASLMQLQRELAKTQQGQLVDAVPIIAATIEPDPASVKPVEISQVERYWPFIAILLSLAVGIAIGITVVDLRIRSQLGKSVN